MKNMRRVISIILVVALIVISAGITAFASSKKVTTGKVNMRKGASLSYKSVKTIPKGTTLTVSDSKTDGRGVTWYYTSYDGKNGWVSSVYLKNPGTSSKRVYTTKGSTYIRTSANKSSKIKGTMPKGVSAPYLGSAVKDGRGIFWYKVSYNKVVGWVSSKYTVLK